MIERELKASVRLLTRRTRNKNKSHRRTKFHHESETKQTQVIFLTSYPPRECGIATYSQDLVNNMASQFGPSFKLVICSLDAAEGEPANETIYNLETHRPEAFEAFGKMVNYDPEIAMVMIQHEFGLFRSNEGAFIDLLKMIRKPVVLSFHTVLPRPNEDLKYQVWQLAYFSSAIIVMTQTSKTMLVTYYDIDPEKISVIAHGTHLIRHGDEGQLKEKYGLEGKKVLTTFGLLGPGKSIETSLHALPRILAAHPDVIFLIIGKTHPSLQKSEGERYREFLKEEVNSLGISDHVKFINKFLQLGELLEYLQLSDIYLFTSKDPNQAVSGTFSYAMSCGCPVISTPIPHALEALGSDAGMIIDFTNPGMMADAAIALLNDDLLRRNMGLNGLQKSVSSAWENATIAHGRLFSQITEGRIILDYQLPELKLDHIRRLTTDFGIIQFSIISRPDPASGYTLDDNARAMIALCRYYEATSDTSVLPYIQIYFDFILFCYQKEGQFMNYVSFDKEFSNENEASNLEDSNGRAIWALGYLCSMAPRFPQNFQSLSKKACDLVVDSMDGLEKIHSPRAMAFSIKGLYFMNRYNSTPESQRLILIFADRLAAMYERESEDGWLWYETYLTYANSVLPEALLCAWLSNGENRFRNIAKTSFDFLLSTIFNKRTITVVSNRKWLRKEERHLIPLPGGEQPIDVAYTILALDKFSKVFPNENYAGRMKDAFHWFLGDNHLHQIIYNPCTGGCYDGLEETNVNLNQGAESTISYLLARLVFENSYIPSEELVPKLP